MRESKLSKRQTKQKGILVYKDLVYALFDQILSTVLDNHVDGIE